MTLAEIAQTLREIHREFCAMRTRLDAQMGRLYEMQKEIQFLALQQSQEAQPSEKNEASVESTEAQSGSHQTKKDEE